MTDLLRHTPELASYWRAIILFGANSATYKFALAQALLDVSENEHDRISLSDLAVPYSQHLPRHLKLEDRQGTAPTSSFLDACRAFNANRIHESELIDTTVDLDFNNVLDAFHFVSGDDVAPDFFHVDDTGDHLVLTDDLFRLREQAQSANLLHEDEARWRLVETAVEHGHQSAAYPGPSRCSKRPTLC
jgi:hypothetical protein